MRFLLKVHIPNDAGNDAARSGTLGTTIQSILEDQQPEAVYFLEEDGQRTGYLFLNMDDVSEVPKLAEPWFLAFNARVTLRPAMTPEDLAKAGPAIEAAVKKYG